MPDLPFVAVVEIGAGAAVLVLAVFILAVVGACAVLWFLSRGTPGPRGTTQWRFDVTQELPVSKPTFDRLADLTERAMTPPALAPGTRAAIDGLGPLRKTLARIYRVALILIGLGGLGLSFVLFRGADSANMQGLPASIILLFSLGAIGSGLIPNRTVDPVEPLDPELFRNIHVLVSRDPLTVRLSQFELAKAKDMLRQGAALDDIARAVYAAYDTLGDSEKRAVQQTLAEALKG